MAEEEGATSVAQTEEHEKKEGENPDSETDDSEEEESDDEDLFEVEKIISRKKRNGVFLYRVRWKGYSPSNDTWEPVDNLDIVADMVQEFDAKQEEKAKSRQEERRIRKLRMEGKKLPGEESSDDDTDSSKEESQLCETTKFFRRLEKDKGLVWSQPDLYSKVKSRAATLANKTKQKERMDELPVSAPSTPKTLQPHSISSRGRGRPRGGAAREKGAGRGRGRPPKRTTSKSSDEEDSEESASQPKNSGRVRERAQSVKEGSSSDLGSDDSQSVSRRTGENRQPMKKESDEKDDTDDSAPLATLDSCKKPEQDITEEKEDSKTTALPVKTDGKHKGRPAKKAVCENSEEKGRSEDSAPLGKSSSRGRGRPRKLGPVKNSDDIDAEPDKTKQKGRGRGRPGKKCVESSEDRDSLDTSAAPGKSQGRGRGRPPKKTVKDSSDENANSDDSVPLAKNSKKAPSKLQKTAPEHSEEKEAFDVSTPCGKKPRRGRGRPRKNVICDTSEDESDSAAAVTAEVQDERKVTAIAENSEEKNSDDHPVSVRERDSQEDRPNKTVEKSTEDTDKSVAKTEDTSKRFSKVKDQGKSHRKFTIEDSEEDLSDGSAALKETQRAGQTADVNKTVKKTNKSKKDSKNKKQHTSVTETVSEKNWTKLEKIESSAVSAVEQATTSVTAGQGSETKSLSAAVGKDTKKLTPVISQSSVQGQPFSKQSSAETLPAPLVGSKSKARPVIPVLEKLAMASVTDGLRIEASDHLKVSGETKDSTLLSGKKDEKPEAKILEKAALGSSKETKEATVSQKKQLAKGVKKGASGKRKQDTAAEHIKAVKEGGASPVKVPSPRPPSSPADPQAVMKTSTPIPQSLADSPQVVKNSCLASGADASAKVLNPPTACASTQEESTFMDSIIEGISISSTAPKLSTEVKIKSSKSKLKDSPKSHKKSSKSKTGSSEKVGKQTTERDGPSVDKSVKTHCSAGTPSAESGLHSSVSVSSVSDLTKGMLLNQDLSIKSASTASDTHTASKPELNAAKLARLDVCDSKPSKSDSLASGAAKPQTLDKTNISDQTEPKVARVEEEDVKRKSSTVCNTESSSTFSSVAVKQPLYRTSSTSDLPSPLSSGTGKQSMIRSGSSSELSSSLSSGVGRQSLISMSTSSPGRSTPVTGKDSLLSTPSKETFGVFSSPSQDSPSLYPYGRDPNLSGRSTTWGSASPRDQSQTSTSPRDTQLSAGPSKDYLTPGFNRDLLAVSGLTRDTSQASHTSQASGSSRDLTLGTGHVYPSSGSTRESPFHSPTSRIFQFSRESWGLPSRPDFNANIPGKDTADKLFSSKFLYKSSVLCSTDGEKAKQLRGIDPDLGAALRSIDLEYVEKLSLPPVTPMELSHEELRQAVMDGNCYLVERALKCTKPYNLDLPDSKGYTLLMNAVLKGYDDIIVHLLTHGANAQVQVKGITALMLAVEHAESCTVYMLLQMGAHVNTADNNGETALFKAVRRGDKQILKLILDHGADFNRTSRTGLTPLQMAKQSRLADIDVTLNDHIQRVVKVFEEEVRQAVGGVARLMSCLFPHHCVPLRDADTITIPFKYQPILPSGPDYLP